VDAEGEVEGLVEAGGVGGGEGFGCFLGVLVVEVEKFGWYGEVN
jgi:hypothetical protein